MSIGSLLEAKDSLVKASTPEPFSTSKTSNWVARGGGLPDYIQHIAHDLMEKRGKSESNAIQMAIGIVKRWARGGGNVDATTRAAAAKAVAEWEKLKAGNAAKGAAKAAVQHSEEPPTLAAELALRESALKRLAEMEGRLGAEGLEALVLSCGELAEAAGGMWSPSMRRCASATEESERHDVLDGAQKVGMISQRKAGIGRGPRWHAFAVNGDRLGGYDGHPSRDGALQTLKDHLAEAPARVLPFPSTGEYLVAKPSSYSGNVSYQSFPSEPAARHAAGLPANPSTPEQNSRVAALGEEALFWLSVVSGEDIPPLRRAQEARRALPFDLGGTLAEAFNASELRGFHGRWAKGGAVARAARDLSAGSHSARLTPSSLPAGPRAARDVSDAGARYEGGVSRMSGETRARLRDAFTAKERATTKTPQPHAALGQLYKLAGARQGDFERILDRGRGIARRLGASVHETKDPRARREAERAVAAAPDKPHVIIGALKGEQRAREKVEGKYGGDASRLSDLVRGTVLVPHVDDLHKAVEAIRAELPPGWTIAAPENRFVEGRRGDRVNTGALSTGYRDIAVLLRAPDGFHTELQINTTHMFLAKSRGGGHALYEDRRRVVERAGKDGLSPQDRLRVQGLDRQARELYGRAMARSTRARLRRAA